MKCKQKEENKENLNNYELKPKYMAYYCKLCKCWHHHPSQKWSSHKRYASKRSPKKLKKDFWERLGKW